MILRLKNMILKLRKSEILTDEEIKKSKHEFTEIGVLVVPDMDSK